uniref:Uncharacterized protein n=1 Tax=Seriola lalandi dorsalis TaxID=1841481 RepID=A0A3B4XCI0_SERLL
MACGIPPWSTHTCQALSHTHINMHIHLLTHVHRSKTPTNSHLSPYFPSLSIYTVNKRERVRERRNIETRKEINTKGKVR